MPLDAVFLSALAQELEPLLAGARIDKVQQPERDLLLLSLYTRLGPRRLLISSNPASPRLHLTDNRYDNPESPPMFCMLLRKHLVGARIETVEQPAYERLMRLNLLCRDELGAESREELVIELMGRSANVILIDGDGIIIDCMRRADFGENAYRRLLPGMLYRLPAPQSRPNVFTLDPASRRSLLDDNASDTPPDKALMDTFTGLCPLIAREIAHRAGGRSNLPEALEAFCESVEAGELSPTMISAEGKPIDFTFMHLAQYGDEADCTTFSSYSQLLDGFYSQRDRAERARRATADTLKTVRTLRDRQSRKLASQREELIATQDREELRKRGELITANLWRVKKGDRVLTCEDYFSDGTPQVELPLDPLKSPQQNAAAAYKEYKKRCAAERHLTGLIEQGERHLNYLESVLDELSRAENERDAADIRAELAESGLIRHRKDAKSKKLRPRAPMRFVSSTGTEILVGRSNAQNDELTFKTARSGDLWLHVKHVHGSHVIIRCGGTTPDEQTQREAASLAVYFSQARDSGKTPVDMTRAGAVRKPAGALPGMVIYTGETTVISEPDPALAERLKAQ